jgi:hypothetical protein
VTLVAMQDGIAPADVEELFKGTGRLGIFLGGTTEYKLETMDAWGDFARAHKLWFHVGRVNSQRRIQQCQLAGATSFDGSSATRFAVTLRPLDNARRQQALDFKK